MSDSPFPMPDSPSIPRAAAILRSGGIVAIPTETVYGLAANAFDANACARVFEAKRRPHFDPLIVHIADETMLDGIVSHVPDDARKLIARFWPGPLTLVLPKRPEIPDIVTAGLPTIAVRMPNHPVALSLIKECGFPLAAPSANPFGYISPTTAEHVRAQLGDKVDYILDGGACAIGVESTIIGWEGDRRVVLRHGGIALEEIECGTGIPACAHRQECLCHIASPGQLPQHYAPRTKIILVECSTGDPACARQSSTGIPACAHRRGRLCHIGYLGLLPPSHPERYAAIEILSESGDLREAATRLFAAMHRLDAQNLDAIHAEPVPDHGIGRAINDRLRRAAG